MQRIGQPVEVVLAPVGDLHERVCPCCNSQDGDGQMLASGWTTLAPRGSSRVLAMAMRPLRLLASMPKLLLVCVDGTAEGLPRTTEAIYRTSRLRQQPNEERAGCHMRSPWSEGVNGYVS